MNEIVCQVGIRRARSSSSGPRAADSSGLTSSPGRNWASCARRPDRSAGALEALVCALNRAGDGAAAWEPAYRAGRGGLPPLQLPAAERGRDGQEGPPLAGGAAEAVGADRPGSRRRGAVGRPEAFLSVPWNLVYDERPAKHKAAFQTGRGRRAMAAVLVDPLQPDQRPAGRAAEADADLERPARRRRRWTRTSMTISTTNRRRRLEAFLAETGLTTVGSMDELEAALEEGYPRLLYWLGHATPEYLQLGDERIAPSDLRNLLRSFDDRERPEGMLAFLNACQTAEAGQAGRSWTCCTASASPGRSPPSSRRSTTSPTSSAWPSCGASSTKAGRWASCCTACG